MPFTRHLVSACLVVLLSACAENQTHTPRSVGVEPTPSALAGGALVRAQCAGCHSVERAGTSPMTTAPAFRDLAARYPVANLQESLGEGMMTAHAAMPEFTFEPTQTADIIAYLESLATSQP